MIKNIKYSFDTKDWPHDCIRTYIGGKPLHAEIETYWRPPYLQVVTIDVNQSYINEKNFWKHNSQFPLQTYPFEIKNNKTIKHSGKLKYLRTTFRHEVNEVGRWIYLFKTI